MHLYEAITAPSTPQRHMLRVLRAAAGCLRHHLCQFVVTEVGLHAVGLLWSFDIVEALPLELIQLQDGSDFVFPSGSFFRCSRVHPKSS